MGGFRTTKIFKQSTPFFHVYGHLMGLWSVIGLVVVVLMSVGQHQYHQLLCEKNKAVDNSKYKTHALEKYWVKKNKCKQ